MMRKIGLIARREFLTTVGNKGFLIGLLIMPLFGVVAVVVGPRILNSRSPQVSGAVAVIDASGGVTSRLRVELDPDTRQARRLASARRAVSQVAPGLESAAVKASGATQRVVAQGPKLRIVELPATADVDREKRWLIAPTRKEDERHLALIFVHPDAVVRAGGKPDFGSYDLFVSATLDANTEGVIFDALRQSLIDARLEASSLDRATVEATMRVDRPESIIVAANGEQAADRGFTRVLPFIMGFLLFLGIMMGGQSLMTSTIEEKSSRVVEVLLAAVSPVELMAGKLLGQLGVGLLMMAVYVGLGILALFQFAMLGLLDPMLLVYLLVFFLVSYLVYGALLAAVGAAVEQLADAQSLLTPVMLTLMVPYALAPVIGRTPNSTFSVAMSFIPPMNTFAMMARLASDAPPPAWQIWLTVLIGLAAAAGAVWFAAKIFKIGLLMRGKAPNFATLVRWARMA
jgi:ABC-2 type transport system permease protein